MIHPSTWYRVLIKHKGRTLKAFLDVSDNLRQLWCKYYVPYFQQSELLGGAASSPRQASVAKLDPGVRRSAMQVCRA